VIGDPKKVVAVVAMGLMVPGADDLDQFWDLIVKNQTAFRTATAKDFGAEPELFYDPSEPPVLDKAYSLVGSWIEGRPSPESLEGLCLPASFDPLECDDSLLYWLLAGKRALANDVLKGHDPKEVGVIAGHVILPTSTQSEAAVSLYGREATRNWEFNPFAPPPRTNPFRAVGYSARLLSVALGLTGPAFTVDAACASSLYATRLAWERLITGELTAVITGGLAKADPLFTQLGFSQLRALSRAGISRPFDHQADGLVVGSGAAALVLKTLDRALADQDEVLAVLLSVGIGNDRTGNLLAPDPEGQARVMLEAFRLANRTPSDLGLVEAHGTSTILGDQAELSALAKLFTGHKINPRPVLGSVKGNVGHLLSAAGAASSVKAILAIKNRFLPPTAGFEKLAPGHPNAPVRILKRGEPWPDHGPRLAAVNAFGFGGVNAQALFEEYRPELWNKKTRPTKKAVSPISLIAARTMLAPWPSYDTLARFWLTPEEPPMAGTRRLGALKTTGFFFQGVTLDTSTLKLPPRELAEALPQQTLVLKAGVAALEAAGLSPDRWPPELDRDRLGIFMGVEIDPRASDLALRWTAPLRARTELTKRGLLDPADESILLASLRANGPPPLTHSRVMGALGSLVASRLARYLGSGGPAFTLSEERDSGFRALLEAAHQLSQDQLDLAVVGVVDTFGDPKTGFLAPRTVWVEGAAIMILAGPKAAKYLEPLAQLNLLAKDSRIGPLSGLFTLNRHAFYLRHHLKPLGRGHGMIYWLKNPGDRRTLTGQGYEMVEAEGRQPHILTVPPDPIRPDVWFYFKASPDNPLEEGLRRLATKLESDPNRELHRLTLDFWREELNRPGLPALAIQARSGRELAELLKKTLAGEEDRDLKPRVLKAPPQSLSDELARGELAFVFPGSGNAYKGLGRGLGLAFPAVMSQLESEVKDPVGQFQSELFWEPNPKKPSCREAILAQVNFGLLGARVMESLGIVPQAALGYSLGETAALVAMGLWPDRDELYQDLMDSSLFVKDLAGELTAARAHWNWPVKKPLKWLAGFIPRSEKAVLKALESLSPAHRFRVFILIISANDEVTVGGEAEAVGALAQALEAPFFPVEEVAAVHAPTVNPVKEAYRQFHHRRVVNQPHLRLYSSAWAKAYQPTSDLVADSLTAQALTGHRFPDLINQAYADGIRYFLEIGPGSGSTRLIKAILGERPHLAVSLAGTAVDEGWAGLSQVLTEFWLTGLAQDPFKGQPRPSPEPDPRFLTPIRLDPPEINWPTPRGAESEDSEEPKEDFMNWLQSQTTKKSEAKRDSSKLGLREPAESSSAEAYPEATTTGQPASDQFTFNQFTPRPLAPSPASLDKPIPDKPVLTRADCLEFAIGSIEKVLGPEFKEVDSYPSRTLLPAEPLMLVDRVLVLEGQAKSLGPGRIVTEKDLRSGDWYLEEGRVSPGMAIESGQADLLLSAYLGADFNTKGLASYRLLDAEVTFQGELPKVNQTARYDIKIEKFFHHGDTLMFKFEFDGSVNGKPLLTMRQGRAGFFTPKALESGRGLVAPPTAGSSDRFENLSFTRTSPAALSAQDLKKIRRGDSRPLGRGFGENASPLLPSGQLALFDAAPIIDRVGGIYGRGFIQTQAQVDPKAWYLVSHFPGDEVMPGTLMYDACLQSLRLYLLTLGWVADHGASAWQPPLGVAQSLKCRGQVTPNTKIVAYEIHVRELLTHKHEGRDELVALAEAIMWADGRPIAEARNLGLRLSGVNLNDVASYWAPAKPRSQQAKTKTRVKTDLLFDKARLNCLIHGQMSEALGSKFSRFDDGSFVARLPQAPYDFIDQAEVTQGQVGRVNLGTSVTAAWRPRADSWLFERAGGKNPTLPYAALNEVALQACGFLSSFMGTALLFNESMYFRNLGGEATVLKEIFPNHPEPLVTRATLTKSSLLGPMTIQHYEFATSQGHQAVYEGQTHFGFFSLDALTKQRGLRAEPNLLAALKKPPLTGFPYPRGQAWPREPWLMLEELFLADDTRRIWGQAKVDPKAWFFQAHFPGDPVWPGSLGLEAFFQAAKFLAVRRYFTDPPETFSGSFAAPLPGRKHSWLYRGQIPPDSQIMELGLRVTKSDPHNRALTFNGLLSVDGLEVYQVDNFTVALREQ
jgi:acyl transferase domain-containing protein/3-hydroxymyristoyl/3-hydroxydecanoyl-(acyl carrier protein) dehydratase